MMTTNLFVIANVKQLRTYVVFRILLPFFRISWCVGILNSAIFNSFHNRVEFGTILEGLRNFGVRHWKYVFTCVLVLKRVSGRGLKESLRYLFSKKLGFEEPAHAFDFSRNGFVSELQESL